MAAIVRTPSETWKAVIRRQGWPAIDPARFLWHPVKRFSGAWMATGSLGDGWHYYVDYVAHGIALFDVYVNNTKELGRP